jgi:hypothetical protein
MRWPSGVTAALLAGERWDRDGIGRAFVYRFTLLQLQTFRNLQNIFLLFNGLLNGFSKHFTITVKLTGPTQIDHGPRRAGIGPDLKGRNRQNRQQKKSAGYNQTKWRLCQVVHSGRLQFHVRYSVR